MQNRASFLENFQKISILAASKVKHGWHRAPQKRCFRSLLRHQMILRVMLHTMSSCHNFKNGKKVNGEKESDERPHYFALRLQQSALDFYRTLSEDTRKSYDEIVRVFKQNVVMRNL